MISHINSRIYVAYIDIHLYNHMYMYMYMYMYMEMYMYMYMYMYVYVYVYVYVYIYICYYVLNIPMMSNGTIYICPKFCRCRCIYQSLRLGAGELHGGRHPGTFTRCERSLSAL